MKTSTSLYRFAPYKYNRSGLLDYACFNLDAAKVATDTGANDFGCASTVNRDSHFRTSPFFLTVTLVVISNRGSGKQETNSVP